MLIYPFCVANCILFTLFETFFKKFFLVLGNPLKWINYSDIYDTIFYTKINHSFLHSFYSQHFIELNDLTL